MGVAVGARRAAVLSCCAATAVLVGACASSAGTGAPAGPRGTLAGRVVWQPTCPVQQFGRKCVPSPVPGAAIEVRDSSAHVVSTRTDQRGRFRLALPYGTYVVQATGPQPLRSSASATVRIGSRGAHIVIAIDSGIR